LWKTSLPTGHSSPVLWGDNIFLTSGDKETKTLGLHCISVSDGKIKWQHELHPEEIERLHVTGNPAQPSAVTDGERVYFYFGSYGLQCYSVSGNLKWERPMPITQSYYGVASSPVLFDNNLVLYREVVNESKLYFFDKTTGDSLLAVTLPPPPEGQFMSHSTPVFYHDQVILHRFNQIDAYSMNHGERLWWIRAPGNGNSTPVLGDNLLFAGTWGELGESDRRGEFYTFEQMTALHDDNKDGFISKDEIPDEMLGFSRPEINIENQKTYFFIKAWFGSMDKDKNGKLVQKEWDARMDYFRQFLDDTGLIALDITDSGELGPESMIWKEKDKVPEVPSPIYIDGNVYMCKHGGILTCMDGKTGEIKYSERIDASGAYFASPVTANGYIYIPSGNGIITVIKAGDKLDIISKNDLKEKIYATPAIVGNTIYIRTTDHLYAYSQN